MSLETIIKAPDDARPVSVDWTDYTGAATISSTDWVVATGLTLGATGEIGEVRTALISGGQEGCDYLATCQVTLNTGEIKEQAVLIKVRTLGEDPRLVR
jgi:hypothetical protein